MRVSQRSGTSKWRPKSWLVVTSWWKRKTWRKLCTGGEVRGEGSSQGKRNRGAKTFSILARRFADAYACLGTHRVRASPSHTKCGQKPSPKQVRVLSHDGVHLKCPHTTYNDPREQKHSWWNENLTVLAHKLIQIGTVVGNGPVVHQLLPLPPCFHIVHCTQRGAGGVMDSPARNSFSPI